MTESQTALGAILPGWFRPAFRPAVVLGTVANNAMTAYSGPGPASGRRPHPPLPQRRHRRHPRRGHDPVHAARLDFLDAVASMLEVMVALLGPSMAIYAADILLRRNRYDGRDLSDQTRTGHSGTPSASPGSAPPP